MRILSMDPGTANYGVSISDMIVKDGELKVKVLGTQMLERPIKNPMSIKTEGRAFVSNIYHLEHLYGPFDLVCAERFQSRGLKGLSIESINMMIGKLHDIYPNIVLYTAGTWKNAFNRVNKDCSLNDTYDMLKVLSKPKSPKIRHQVHELDCTLMAQYHVAKQFDLIPFANLEGEARIISFLRHLDKSAKL